MNSFPENPDGTLAPHPDASPGLSDTAAEQTPVPPRDPAWGGLDLVLLTVISILSLIVGFMATLVAAKLGIYPHRGMLDILRMPLIVIVGQALGYLIVLVYMYLLVTRHYHRPDFLAAIHWNWPTWPSIYVLAGLVLSVALQILAHRLPIPKNLPIDNFFRTPAEAWTLTVFGITLAPLMEELFFRGFLYPVLERSMGLGAAVVFTAAAFALLHGSQLMFAWGPVLVILLVGLVLTVVRAKTNSVAASLLIHVAYNTTIAGLMFKVTDGFRHLEKLSGQ